MSRTLLFEIGTEEIPSVPLYRAIEQLESGVPAALEAARLTFGEVHVSGTPRRLSFLVQGLADEQPDLEQTVKGPPAHTAFDDDGEPTKAATGFARKYGLDVNELECHKEGAQEYVYATVREEGRSAVEVLPGVLADLTASIDWPKSMRWGSGTTRFTRPIRWLVCLLDDVVVPVEFAGLIAGRHTQGHRFLADNPVEIPTAIEYGNVLGRAFVMADITERASLVRHGVETVASMKDAVAVIHEKTFAEVVNLVEWPTPAIGTFDEDFLSVPREVLETAMESHQRYFPVESQAGDLLPHFIVVHNGPREFTEAIVEGHERVIRARLADATFFWEEDLKRPLEEYVQRLETIVFQERLGTMADRVERVELLTRALAEQVDAGADECAWAVRAAHLAKADLVTNMVVEFPSLQGTMGRYYALASEEAPQVADGILEHYQPRFAGDGLPSSMAGRLVSLADKLDSIVGIFGAGMPPTGSADPYGLRRGALGILNIIIEAGLALRLDDAIAAALKGFGSVLPGLDKETVGAEVKEFILGRMETVLKSRGHAYDTVEAILAVTGDDPADAAARAAALTRVRAGVAIDDLATAYSRAKNLSDVSLGVEADVSIMGSQELALADALTQAEEATDAAIAAGEHDATLATLSSLRAPIDAFFDEVLVMDEDRGLRENRLRLLNRFVELFSRFADFSRLAE